MDRSSARITLGILALVAGACVVVLSQSEPDAHAEMVGQITGSQSGSFNCPPFNIYNPDAGANGVVACSSTDKAFRAVRIESESGNYYICGRTGCATTTVTSKGLLRGPTQRYGGAFTSDIDWGLVRCLGDGAAGTDGGTAVKVFCGK